MCRCVGFVITRSVLRDIEMEWCLEVGFSNLLDVLIKQSCSEAISM